LLRGRKCGKCDATVPTDEHEYIEHFTTSDNFREPLPSGVSSAKVIARVWVARLSDCCNINL
jgi:hypothetical protein